MIHSVFSAKTSKRISFGSWWTIRDFNKAIVDKPLEQNKIPCHIEEFIRQNFQNYSSFVFLPLYVLYFLVLMSCNSGLFGAEPFLWVSSKQSHQSWTQVWIYLRQLVLAFGSGSQQCKIQTENSLHDIIKRLNRREYSQTCTMTLKWHAKIYTLRWGENNLTVHNLPHKLWCI